MSDSVKAPGLDDYAPIVGKETIDELRHFAAPLKGRRLVMVNSTKVGGGVAEMLARLVPMMNELGVDCRWEVLKGNQDFYRVTKSWHNAIHGAPVKLSAEDVDVYTRTNRENAAELDLDADIVAIHDPQPAALIETKRPDDARKWVWRCHIDASHPAPGVWDILSSYVERYDASIFTLPDFAKMLPIPQYLFFPCIDPLTEKNREMSKEEVESVLAELSIPRDKPYIVQVSRYDWLKDPVGVYKAYKIAKQTNDIRLVLAGGSADDDPEGAEVLAAVRKAVGDDPDCHILELPPDANREINALQRGAAVVIQKSTREGFGLTVTEGLWKAKPVVAGAVGGIPTQVLHGVTGLLCRTPEGCAYQIRYLLANPAEQNRLGELGREWVRSEFLITQNLRRWLLLMHALENPGERLISR